MVGYVLDSIAPHHKRYHASRSTGRSASLRYRFFVSPRKLDEPAAGVLSMTTAEALEGLPDAARFELLATRALRELRDDCRAIAHLGMNAPGKTIPNPFDTFHLVPGSNPPRWVIGAFTITTPARLQRKWLFDHTTAEKTTQATAVDDGDLVKAGREAAGIRATDSTATFIVYLCTNHILNHDLIKLAQKKASQLGVEARFLEQSELRDFLDTQPVGQWLRQEHLGIVADQVSWSLLQQLSQSSLDQYAAQLILTIDQMVPTRAAAVAADAIHSPDISLHLLIGPSGLGKSVIAQDLLRRHIASGGVGIWVPSEVAERAISPANAVETVLRSLHPRINPEAGHDTLRLAAAHHPLLVVVDDINRSDNPPQLLRKVIAWSQPPGQNVGQGGVPKSVHVICPVWDSYWLPLRHMYEAMHFVRVQIVDRMRRSEAIDCLRAALRDQGDRFTNMELDGFATRLSDDPILLGLFGSMLRTDPDTDPVALSENVIGHLVGNSIGELAVSRGLVPADFESALARLSRELIRKKVLYPYWADLQSWLQTEPRVLDALSQLAAQGHICQVSKRDGNHRFEFRHDRILEYHLTRAGAEMLYQGGDERESVQEPFFTPTVGQAVGRFPLPGAVLAWIGAKLPNGLVAAIPHLPAARSDYTSQVVARAREWLVNAESAHESARFDAFWTLAATNSPYVLEVTDGVLEHALLLEARLRNGDAVAGAKALSREFYPAIRHTWLEALIDQARTHHGPQLVEKLRSILTADGLDDKLRAGALCLAGYLEDPSLAGAIQVAWQKATDRLEIILPALWAGLRCAGDEAAGVIGPMMPAILKLPHDMSGRSSSRLSSVLRDLRSAMRHGISDAVVHYLADLGMAEETYRSIVAAVLDDVDHPVAIQYVASLLADAQHRAEQAGGFSPWASIWLDGWKGHEKSTDRRLSAASLAALRSLWDDESQPDWLQKYAFSIWSRYVNYLSELRAVPAHSQHFEAAAWQRALRGDPEIVPYVLEKLSDNRRWFHVVPPIWSQEFVPAIDAALAELATELGRGAILWSNIRYDPRQLLRDIPTKVAEQLLEKYWGDLGTSLFIQTALYHGTKNLRALATKSIGLTDPEKEPLRFVGSFFGFFTQGLMDRLSVRHLETLRPYLHRLDDFSIHDMIEFCRRYDHWGWALQHLRPECRRRTQAAKPGSGGDLPYIVSTTWQWFRSDEELLEDLDEIETGDSRRHGGRVWFWWKRFIERGDSLSRPSQLLEQWLLQSPSLARFKIVARALRDRGTRQDLAMLWNCTLDPRPQEVESILADVEFAVMRRSLE